MCETPRLCRSLTDTFSVLTGSCPRRLSPLFCPHRSDHHHFEENGPRAAGRALPGGECRRDRAGRLSLNFDPNLPHFSDTELPIEMASSPQVRLRDVMCCSEWNRKCVHTRPSCLGSISQEPGGTRVYAAQDGAERLLEGRV